VSYGAKPFTPQTYSAIVRDSRLSHGAFRYWHLLRDYASDDGVCYPGMRRLSRELGSNPGRIAKWREELIGAGYLSVAPRKNGQFMRYRLHGGVAATVYGLTPMGDKALPQPSTVSVDGLLPTVDGLIAKPLPQPSTKPNPVEPTPDWKAHLQSARKGLI
jgi:hypothetical protein